MQPEAASRGTSPIDVVRILWRRRWLLVTVVGLGMSGAVAATALLPKVYAARAAVLIEPRLEPSPDGSGGVVPILPDSATIDSLVQVLGSRSMAREVIDAHGLARDPELVPPDERSWLSHAFASASDNQPLGSELGLVDRFLDRLTVAREGKSHVIAVTYLSRDPRHAAAIANALAERFVADRAVLRHEAGQRATGTLGARLDLLEAKLGRSRSALDEARVRLGPATADATTLGGQVAQVRRELVAASAERSSLESRVARLRQQLREQGADARLDDGAATVLGNLEVLKAASQRREAEMAANLGERHPRLVEVRAELAELQARIERQQRAVLDERATEAEAARAKERALAAVLQDLELRAAAGSRAAAELQVLEQQAEQDRRLYEVQLGRVKGVPEASPAPLADVRVISEATTPTAAVFPRPPMMLTAGFTASLLIGLFAVYASEQADRRIRTPDDVRAALGLPTLGLVPELSRRAARKTPPQDWPSQHPGSREAEAVRSLLAAVRGEGVKVVMLTSSVPHEGKSSLALALGRMAAEDGVRTLLVDADLRRPSIATLLGQPGGRGLSELAAGRVGLLEAIVPDLRSPLHIIPGGAVLGPPTGLLGEDGVPAVIAAARKAYDLVVVDTAPLLPVSDAVRLAPHVDRLLFVLRWGHTTGPLAAQALQQLGAARERVAGVAITRVDLARHRAWATGDAGLAYARYRRYYMS
ncbi:MAG TPA: Wzz/FepE/Etk N-terminal domain-containing protein [Geminicoccaceae bacterium]|nr:Wzz/FepE/Etk N-terminal domain-containing protein [Geminicoccus sp.]HMU51294.1 Wzz/FepE/Etk N-terminal domain-containing protein [Geminicoccaceae bacterium]